MDEMNISEKVAYIKGLVAGKNQDDEVINAILDVLGDIAAEIDDIEDVVSDMGDQIDAVDEDLASVEELIYDDEDDGCCCCGDDECYEVECPECKETICLDADALEEDGFDCPNCGTHLEFDFDGCDCDCDCCCDCDEPSDED